MANNFLLIESGTNVCSVAFATDNKIVGIRESSDEKAHAAQLTVFIEQLIKKTKISIRQLNAVVISKGPGSYTGLRIGVSVAKGICYAAEKPLIAINSLESMTYGANLRYQSTIHENKIDYLCPMIDARRMEVYTSIYDSSIHTIKEIEALVVDEQTFSQLLESKKILFFGNGAAKCESIINHPHAFFVDDFSPSAQYMLPLAKEAVRNNIFEDVAYFEPFYLKDFVATKSLKKVFPEK